MGKYAEAVSLLLRFAVACNSLQLQSSHSKAYLGAVVVWLYAQKAGEAWAVYQVCRDLLIANWLQKPYLQPGLAMKSSELLPPSDTPNR